MAGYNSKDQEVYGGPIVPTPVQNPFGFAQGPGFDPAMLANMQLPVSRHHVPESERARQREEGGGGRAAGAAARVARGCRGAEEHGRGERDKESPKKSRRKQRREMKKNEKMERKKQEEEGRKKEGRKERE